MAQLRTWRWVTGTAQRDIITVRGGGLFKRCCDSGRRACVLTDCGHRVLTQFRDAKESGGPQQAKEEQPRGPGPARESPWHRVVHYL